MGNVTYVSTLLLYHPASWVQYYPASWVLLARPVTFFAVFSSLPCTTFWSLLRLFISSFTLYDIVCSIGWTIDCWRRVLMWKQIMKIGEPGTCPVHYVLDETRFWYWDNPLTDLPVASSLCHLNTASTLPFDHSQHFQLDLAHSQQSMRATNAWLSNCQPLCCARLPGQLAWVSDLVVRF